MRILSLRSRGLVLVSVLAAWTVAGLACSVEDENPATTRQRGSDSGASSSGSVDEGGAPPASVALCDTLGGYEGVKGVALDIVNRSKTDCRISPVVSGAANDQHAIACFQIFVGSSFQCPGITFVVNQTRDPQDKRCNSRFPGLELSNEDFNALLENTRDALKAKGLSDDQVKDSLPVFENARLDLTQDSNVPRGKFTQCAANCQAGGEKCIRQQPPNNNDGGNNPPQDAGNDSSPPDDAGGEDDASSEG